MSIKKGTIPPRYPVVFGVIRRTYHRQPHKNRKRRRSKIAATPYLQLCDMLLCTKL